MREPRFDFKGGLNTRFSPEQVAPNQLVASENFRVSEKVGALEARLGSRRIHATALAAAVTGLGQWVYSGTRQLVAVSNGDLSYKTTAYGNFTTTSPTPALGSTPAHMFTARNAAASAALYLYVVDGTNVWRWDGASLTRVSTGANKPPANSYLGRVYHIRSFFVSSDRGQHVVWTGLGLPEDTTVGSKDQGGEAMVDVLRGEAITALEVLGSSLLIGTSGSVVRYTGYSSSDIQISQDTEGVSPDQGPAGPLCLRRINRFAAMICDEGFYAVDEAEAKSISELINPDFEALAKDYLSAAVVCPHKGRNEIWFAVSGASDSGLNKTVYVYSTTTGAWFGPFTYPFGITCMIAYKRTDGSETILAGGPDGWIRDMDIGTADDVLSDGTGGSDYSALAELAPFYFDAGPGTIKTLERTHVHGEIPTDVQVDIKYAFDQQALTTVPLLGIGGTTDPYRLDTYGQGDMLRVQISADVAAGVVIRGVAPKAFNMVRESE